MTTKPRTYTVQEKRECVQRELTMRRKMYPHWIASGKLERAKAMHELAVMEAILADYAPGRTGRLL